jgi:type II secretory pathway pseudopilin PulG
MLMKTDRTKQRGFLMVELMVSTVLLGMAITGLAVTIQGVSVINQYQWTRQRCAAAAEAQLDSLAAAGKPIDGTEMQRLWPDIQVTMGRTAGQAAWQGLDLVHVTAAGRAGPHGVTVRLERYFPKGD